MKEQKNLLRQQFINERKNIPESQRQEWDRQITSHVVNCCAFLNAEEVFCFVGKEEEVQTKEILQACFDNNKKVAVPKTLQNGEIKFYYIESFNQLELGNFGVLEPVIAKTKPVKEFKSNTVCITPGLSFSLQGDRLGYGKGYYDRFFQRFLGIKVGLCYESFLKEKIPIEQTDQKVHFVITQKGVLEIGERTGKK